MIYINNYRYICNLLLSAILLLKI